MMMAGSEGQKANFYFGCRLSIESLSTDHEIFALLELAQQLMTIPPLYMVLSGNLVKHEAT